MSLNDLETKSEQSFVIWRGRGLARRGETERESGGWISHRTRLPALLQSVHSLENYLETRLNAAGRDRTQESVVSQHSQRVIEAALDYSSIRVARVVARHQVLRGWVETVQSEPLITEKSFPLVHFIAVSLPDGKRVLRENHGFGYHYHYANEKDQRSDVLLTFLQPRKNGTDHVTWEPHAVSKAKFKARVERWKNPKRQSVHCVCVADLAKRNLADYLRPGKGAQILL